MSRIVLASASPRRAELLGSLGIEVLIHPTDVDEAVLSDETAEAHAHRLSRVKAEAARRVHPGRWILAGDTVVTVEGAILGKPSDPEDALSMLLRLQGKTHEVVSALALSRPAQDGPPMIFSGVRVTRVTFRPFDRELAEGYVRTGEPMDKAGAYGIQGLGCVLVERIDGDYTGVVGLPVSLFLQLTEEAGRPFRFPA